MQDKGAATKCKVRPSLGNGVSYMPTLSVIMPAYNEAGSIEAAVGDVLTHVCSVVPETEIIVVDDGSRDQTPAILAAMAGRVPQLRIVTQANAGHGPALLRGLAEARGRVLLLLDSDRQIALDAFAGHWKRLQDENLLGLIGIRRPRNDPPHRLVITRLMRAAIALSFGRSPQDAGVPYKLLRREAWEEADRLIPDRAWIPSVLAAIVLLRRHPDRVREVVVTHLARDHGTSALNYRRLARFCRHAFGEIRNLRRELR